MRVVIETPTKYNIQKESSKVKHEFNSRESIQDIQFLEIP